jgi:hypothetical protein
VSDAALQESLERSFTRLTGSEALGKAAAAGRPGAAGTYVPTVSIPRQEASTAGTGTARLTEQSPSSWGAGISGRQTTVLLQEPNSPVSGSILPTRQTSVRDMIAARRAGTVPLSEAGASSDAVPTLEEANRRLDEAFAGLRGVEPPAPKGGATATDEVQESLERSFRAMGLSEAAAKAAARGRD